MLGECKVRVPGARDDVSTDLTKDLTAAVGGELGQGYLPLLPFYVETVTMYVCIGHAVPVD